RLQRSPPRVVLTMSQMGKGTLRRRWELSEVTEGTPAHQRMENSQGSFTVYRFTLRLGDMQDLTKPPLLPSATVWFELWGNKSFQQDVGTP
uniref:Uncharacterized protein n=1 Tax=Taeniopygia guttata TaxID=59729 RepID=A0A674GC14_TAEGU